MAAEHFVGMLFWIPVNKAMFTGDDDYAATHELVPSCSVCSKGVHECLRGALREPNEDGPNPTVE